MRIRANAFILGGIVGAICVTIILFIAANSSERQSPALSGVPSPRNVSSSAQHLITAELPPQLKVGTAALQLSNASVIAEAPPSQPAQPQSPAPRASKEPIQDPVAREALAFVGLDLEAEEYWYTAINDASLSAHERQDLIEDLNEEGFPDPKHPTVDDLPLILNRIVLIEELAWDAMDKVNADAFAEAYKDLVNMLGTVAAR